MRESTNQPALGSKWQLYYMSPFGVSERYRGEIHSHVLCLIFGRNPFRRLACRATSARERRRVLASKPTARTTIRTVVERLIKHLPDRLSSVDL